ncbi:MAG: TIGR00266 family protein [bacterium]|nr:TIGR00266 family protein [bacterium]
MSENLTKRICHQVDYKVVGEDLQFVEVELDSGETIVAEAGAMMYMEDGIQFEAKMGDGSGVSNGIFDKLMGAGKRILAGESLFLTHFTNRASVKRKVAFGAPYPGKITALDMSLYPDGITCQKDGFLCAAFGTKLSITFTQKFGTGLFGGEGFVLQKIIGDGHAFVHAGGSVIEKKLSNDKLMIDTGCIVGFTSGIEYSIQRAGNLKSMFFGGEGLFMATLAGSGTVWLQSLPFSRLADRIYQNMPRVGGTQKEEGSVLGSLAKIMER